MTRIEKTFKALNRPALITFITACDPDYARSLAVLKTLPEAGADIIELGMPFTDPVADGPTVEAASQRALAAGGSMINTLKMVREFRAANDDTPIVLMGYYNPILQYGPEKFLKDASQAGVDGLIIVDLPPEEANEIQSLISNLPSLDLIRLITPTSDKARLPKLLKDASGFLYYVSITGITGAAKADTSAVSAHIKIIKQSTDLPIAVGFGIRTPQDAKTMAAFADAVVVGSSIVQNIADHADDHALCEIIHKQVSSLANALKS